jgi:hypothetical protein
MIEKFLNVEKVPVLLRIETTKGENEIRIPPFLQVEREVTFEKDYCSRILSSKI